MANIPFIDFIRRMGDNTRAYVMTVGSDRVQALVSEEEQAFFQQGTHLDDDIAKILLSDLAEAAMEEAEKPEINTIFIDRANDILGCFGYTPIDYKEPTVPFDEKGYVRVRHYMGKAKAQDIQEKRQFGGRGFPLDQGKVFVEPVKWRVLSSGDFREKYAITNGNPGTVYFEFMVKDEDLKCQTNPRNGNIEYFVEANGQKESNPIYKIASEVKLFQR